jgi:hypothetical protein
MTYYTGRNGIMRGPQGGVPGNAIVNYGKVTAWSLQGDLETLETTTLGDAQRSYTPGVLGYSGSATLLYYEDGGNNDASNLLRQVVRTGGVTAPVQLTLRLASGGVNRDVTLDVYITSASIGATVGEVSSAQISFQAAAPITQPVTL